MLRRKAVTPSFSIVDSSVKEESKYFSVAFLANTPDEK
jgi:hypothetical protein